jgi:hypothetical protein
MKGAPTHIIDGSTIYKKRRVMWHWQPQEAAMFNRNDYLLAQGYEPMLQFCVYLHGL